MNGRTIDGMDKLLRSQFPSAIQLNNITLLYIGVRTVCTITQVIR